jgi:polyisoprenoid-binding protein YceI
MRRMIAPLLIALGTPAIAQDPPIPAGHYVLDPYHSTISFELNHIGFSQFVATFDRFNAEMDLDPEDPAAAQLRASIETASLDPPPPPDGFMEMLLGPDWLNAADHPEITFVSDRVELTGDTSANIHGTLTLLGKAAPMTLSARFNGGYAGHPLDPNARIGFSATGSLNRSDYGLDLGIPPPGSTMGVSDEIKVRIETEFIGPPLKQ